MLCLSGGRTKNREGQRFLNAEIQKKRKKRWGNPAAPQHRGTLCGFVCWYLQLRVAEQNSAALHFALHSGLHFDLELGLKIGNDYEFY